MRLSDRLARPEGGAEGASRPRPHPLLATPQARPGGMVPPARDAERPRARTAGPAREGARPAVSDDVQTLKVTVRTAVIAKLGPSLAVGEVDDARLRNELDTQLAEALQTSKVTVPPSERHAFIESTLADMLGWGVLTPLMGDPDVSEVMCNNLDEIWVERAGRLERTDLAFPSMGAYRQVIDRMLATAGRRVDEASPMADGRLPDGSRVNAVIPPLAVRGPILTVRRFPEQGFSVTDLITRESVSQAAAVFLEAAVRGKLNIVVSGGTGTGKTTLLNVLSCFVPAGERIVTVEDAAELRLTQEHVLTLEGRPANIEGAGHVTIRDLVRNALRMRPDRIVVGEVRGGEALDMLQAMNTGHEGSLTTVHANSARDALSRIETMVLMAGLDLPLRVVREQVASALDLVVQLERRPDGSRVVSAVVEISGREGETVLLQDIFTRTHGGPLLPTGLRPRCLEVMADRGVTVPAGLLASRVQPVLARRTR